MAVYYYLCLGMHKYGGAPSVYDKICYRFVLLRITCSSASIVSVDLRVTDMYCVAIQTGGR